MRPQLSWPAFPQTPSSPLSLALSKKFQERTKAWQAAGRDKSRLSGKSLAIISRYHWVALVTSASVSIRNTEYTMMQTAYTVLRGWPIFGSVSLRLSISTCA